MFSFSISLSITLDESVMSCRMDKCKRKNSLSASTLSIKRLMRMLEIKRCQVEVPDQCFVLGTVLFPSYFQSCGERQEKTAPGYSLNGCSWAQQHSLREKTHGYSLSHTHTHTHSCYMVGEKKSKCQKHPNRNNSLHFRYIERDWGKKWKQGNENKRERRDAGNTTPMFLGVRFLQQLGKH